MCEIKSVILYKTHIDAFAQLPPEQFKKTILALCDYATDGTLPEDDPVVYAMVMLAKHTIDARNAKIENGAKGGRPKANQKQTEPNENQTETKQNQAKPNTKQKNQLQVTSYKLQDKKDNKNIYNAPFAEIIGYLNTKAGTAYRATSEHTKRHIQARWNEKYTVDDFKKVIDNKVAEWKGTDMERFLRPETLFGSKFESYLNGKAKPKDAGNKNRFNNFHQREYDWDNLERSLLNANNAD